MARPPSVILALAGVMLSAVAGQAAPVGLAEWIGGRSEPSAAAAQQFISGEAGRLHVYWRTVGAEQWEGDLADWRAAQGGLVAGQDGGLLKATLKVEAWRGAMRLRLTLTATRAATQPTEVVVRCPFEPTAWRRAFYPKLPYLQMAPEGQVLLRFAADAGDATSFTDAPGVAFYPFGVLEDGRAFVLWGSPDVGRYAVLSPNAIAPGVPSLSLRPKRLEAGQQLDFDLVIKRFEKPECRYRDVLAWYMRSAFSSDPLVRDLFPWDGKRRARPMPVGNVGSGLGRLSEPAGEAVLLDGIRQMRVGGLWFQGWGPWDETYRTEGEWRSEWWQKFSAKQIRDELGWEKQHGIAPYLYCRQFLAEQGVHDDRPPYRDWVGRDETGARMAWGDYPVPDQAAAEVGFKTLQQSCADFGNPAFLKWYEERVKACMDFYQPGGIAWDMGWGAGLTWGYSRATPRTPNGDGMLRAQADLWTWLHAKHPEMRTIANEGIGTPSQWFADAVLLEGGFASGKTELDYEAARALGTTVISYEYPAQYTTQVKGIPTQTARYVQMRYRATGLNTKSDRYVVYPSQEVVGKEGPAIVCSQLVADGEWHVATFDMRGLPTVEEVKGCAFGMESAAEEAHLWVDYVRFSATPDGPAVESGADSFPANITEADASAFEPRPGWVTNKPTASSVRRDQGAIEFTVRGAGKGMSWSFFPAYSYLAQEYMKVLSLGACIGAGVRPGWTTLNQFSAQAMALTPMVGSHDIEVRPDTPGVTAAAWGSGGRLLVAAYNGSKQAREVTVTVAATGVRQSGAAPKPTAVSWIMGKGAEPKGTGPAAMWTAKGEVRLPVRLEPGEELLWGNWGWE